MLLLIIQKAVNGSVSLLIRWNSSQIKQYAGVSIDVKVGDFHDTLEMFEEKDTVRHYDTTRTNQFTLDNVDIGKKYWIRIRGRDAKNALSISGKAPIALYYVSEHAYTPKSPYEATVVFDKRGAYWSWKQPPQNDYQWTELRLDTNVGEEHNRLDLTTDWNSTAKPYARIGTGYIYNKGVGNSYSALATVNYSKAVPPAPNHVAVAKFYEGLTITFDNIPEDCNGANIYINNEVHHVISNVFTFNCSTGEYTIKICYTDIFGEGEMSQSVKTSTVEEIPPNAIHVTNKTVFDDGVIVAKYIGDKAVVGTKIADGAITTDKLVANAITGDKIAANAITSDKIKTGEITAAKIATGTITGDKLKANTITSDKIVTGSISGDKIAANSISGDKIKAGAIDTNKLEAGAVDAQKLNVDRLDAITSNVGNLVGGSITGGTFKNSTGTFKIDPDGNIIGANIVGSKISADTIFQSGYHLKNLDVQIHRVKHGEWCPIPEGFTEEQCTFVPVGYLYTEVYTDNGSTEIAYNVDGTFRRRLDNGEFDQQKARWLNSCDIYFVSRSERDYYGSGSVDSKTLVGLREKRRAVVGIYRHSRTSGEHNDTETYGYTYGDLFVLCIAQM